MAKKKKKAHKGKRQGKKLGRTPCGKITIVSGKVRRRYSKVSAAIKAARSIARHGHSVRAIFGRACKVK